MVSAARTGSVRLPSGEAVPALGQGTWGLAEGKHDRKQEIRALLLGIELGMSLVDTAEMYGDGETEKLVGEAIQGRRNPIFLVSKVLLRTRRKLEPLPLVSAVCGGWEPRGSICTFCIGVVLFLWKRHYKDLRH